MVCEDCARLEARVAELEGIVSKMQRPSLASRIIAEYESTAKVPRHPSHIAYETPNPDRPR